MDSNFNVNTVRLSRDSLTRPWGFRLHGGRGSGFPLSVQRIFSGSPSEGILKKDDIILSIDNYDVSGMNHSDVSDIIRVSGGNLIVRLKRNKESFINNNPPTIISSSASDYKHAPPSRREPMTISTSQQQYSVYAAAPTAAAARWPVDVDADAASLDQIQKDIENDPDYAFIKKSVQERCRTFDGRNDFLRESTPVIGSRRGGNVRSFKWKPPPPMGQVGRHMEFGWAPSQDKVMQAKYGALTPSRAAYVQASYIPSLTGGQTEDDAAIELKNLAKLNLRAGNTFSQQNPSGRARCYSTSHTINEPGTSFITPQRPLKISLIESDIRPAHSINTNREVYGKGTLILPNKPSSSLQQSSTWNEPNVYRIVKVSNNQNQQIQKALPLSHSLPRNFQSSNVHIVREASSAKRTTDATAAPPSSSSFSRQRSSNNNNQSEFGQTEFGASDF